MALKLAGEETGIQERVVTITYTPGLATTGDIEPATHTVTATSKAGSPDYTSALTLPAPSDARLKVLRLCLRLQATIDSFGGAPAATQMSYSVHVNGAERLTGSWNAAGGQYASIDLTEGQFNLGSPNSIALYLWVDQGNAVVSVAQAWLAVGTNSLSATTVHVLQFLHRGFIAYTLRLLRVGTGAPSAAAVQPEIDWLHFNYVSGNDTRLVSPAALAHNQLVRAWGTVSTDLNYVEAIAINVRSLA